MRDHLCTRNGLGNGPPTGTNPTLRARSRIKKSGECAQKGGQHLTPCWSTPDKHFGQFARVENLPSLTKPQICFREVGDSHAQDWCTCQLMRALHCRARMPFAPREVLQMLLAQWKHWSERTRMALASSGVHHLTKRTLRVLVGTTWGHLLMCTGISAKGSHAAVMSSFPMRSASILFFFGSPRTNKSQTGRRRECRNSSVEFVRTDPNDVVAQTTREWFCWTGSVGTPRRRVCARALGRQSLFKSQHRELSEEEERIATSTFFMKDVEDVCSPFQFALSTRAGTDCVVHAVRALTDLNPDRTVMSIDGIGAYDHVFRSSMLARLHDEPRLHGLLPFVRALFSERSC